MITVESVQLRGGYCNDVRLVDGVVAKEFIEGTKVDNTASRIKREQEALLKFGGILAPAFIGIANNTIYQEFLEGYNLHEAVDGGEDITLILSTMGQMLATIHDPVDEPEFDPRIDFDEKVKVTVPRAIPMLEKYELDINKLKPYLEFDWRPVMEMGPRFIHGDFQIQNIMWTPKGVRIIDWESSGIGTPYTDFSRIDALSFKRFNLAECLFWEGYGMIPNQTALDGFIVKHLLHHMGKLGSRALKDRDEDVAFNKHIATLLKGYQERSTQILEKSINSN